MQNQSTKHSHVGIKQKGCRTFDSLPDTAKSYIEVLEEMIGTKIGIISTSPDRDDTIIR